MLAWNYLAWSVIFWAVTCNATVNWLFYNRNLILIWTRNSWFLTSGVYTHWCILNILVTVKVSDIHLPYIKWTRAVATLTNNGSKTKITYTYLSSLVGNWFLIDEREKKIHGVEMVMIKNIVFPSRILSQDNLLSSKKGAVLVIEVHFLLVANTWMGNP